jgi:hypothetical protein
MDVCILKYKKTNQAERVLNGVLSSQLQENPWVHEIAVIRRPIFGRISIRATFADPALGGRRT